MIFNGRQSSRHGLMVVSEKNAAKRKFVRTCFPSKKGLAGKKHYKKSAFSSEHAMDDSLYSFLRKNESIQHLKKHLFTAHQCF